MNEYWVVYDTATGLELFRGQGMPGSFAVQQAGAGRGVLQIDEVAATSSPLNLELVKASACTVVDAQAEAMRGQYLTTGSGQAMTYLAKQAEATAYLANNAAPTPFLTVEAEATGVTIGTLAAAVQANATAWVAIGAKIEAARRKAKLAVDAATNVGEIHAASQIDWLAAVA